MSNMSPVDTLNDASLANYEKGEEARYAYVSFDFYYRLYKELDRHVRIVECADAESGRKHVAIEHIGPFGLLTVFPSRDIQGDEIVFAETWEAK